jgi:hydroxyacylglutathione hydrolase
VIGVVERRRPGAEVSGLRTFRADDPGPFTLDGTRTHLVGRRRPAVVDPGPDLPEHRTALLGALRDATEVTLLLTHGHADHAGGVSALVEALDVAGIPATVRGSGHQRAQPLRSGQTVESDAGTLVAIPTPGHTADHLAFHWPRQDVVFPGDTVLGAGETTWVGEYSGCVADYLESLDRLRTLGARLLLSAHGPPRTDVAAVLDRFEAHRRRRIEEVHRILLGASRLSDAALFRRVYGDDLPTEVRDAARRSVVALRHHVESGGRPG